jgi:hypothetical protein
VIICRDHVQVKEGGCGWTCACCDALLCHPHPQQQCGVTLCVVGIGLQVDVISRGHSGYNSRWGLKLFQQVLHQVSGRQVALLTIWLGANDAAIPGRSA